ncbi:MAG: TlpA family protein disulfide reductase [Actinobacteria bacterium]|nr:TlpA family protein disulfide reductase [Actinomycetota bacterium]
MTSPHAQQSSAWQATTALQDVSSSAERPPRSARARRVSRRLGIPAGAAIVLAIVAAGCAPASSLAEQYRDGSNKGFIAGNFQVVEIAEKDRGKPVVFEGVTETGNTVTSGDYRGGVLVVNFWYAACGPCIVEAPLLERVWQEYKGKGVEFLGVNTYDQPATALSFAKDNGVTYPSVIDVTDGTVKLAFAQVTPIQATPTTLVIDRTGRVAARVIGQLGASSILSTLVSDTLAEDAP